MRIIKKENLKLFLQKRSLHPKCETRKKLKGVKNRTFVCCLYCLVAVYPGQQLVLNWRPGDIETIPA